MSNEDWKHKYEHCSECGNPLTPELAAWNTKRFQTSPCCKPECVKSQHVKFGHICCMEGKFINCVCAYASDCPKHGVIHRGTHD